MLIDSPRLTGPDRAHWQRAARFDRLLAADPRLDVIEREGIEAVHAFAAAGPFYISASWGKDSVAAAHLALKAVPDAEIVWVKSVLFDTPECETVRDAFLTAHPGAAYRQIDVVMRNPKRGEPGYEQHHTDPAAGHQDVLKENLTGRYVSGLRADESRIRRISIGHRGLATPNTCRPIGRWCAEDVFAYLEREGLPVHPVYAMTMGGHYDRRWLRVHPLCSAPPARSAVYGRDMDAWEDRYYGDVIAAAHVARAHLWTPA